jgi:hypothetical protein
LISASRANNVQVLLGNSLDSLTEVAFSAGQIENIWSVPLPAVTLGRYVKLVHKGHRQFHLCEVQVFATAGIIWNFFPFSQERYCFIKCLYFH